MADISVRGFVSKPNTRNGSKGEFATFTLSEGVKNKEGSYDRFFYNVTNFHSPTPPEDGSRVTVKGWLKLRKHNDRTYMDVVAEDITVEAGPRPASTNASDNSSDPWDK